MRTYRHLGRQLFSLENLERAYWRARKGKASKSCVLEFDEHWRLHLVHLRKELLERTYRPAPLKKFVLRDPKTRIISVSAFRDRVVHHALVNILQPIYEPRFIHDSYASRKGKGTLPALRRFDDFKQRVTKNGRTRAIARNGNDVIGHALKADIRHYFDTVDHETLIGIIKKRVPDEDILWLARTILENYDSGTPGKGMPLGNWTSQFFANIYLDELDQYIKHTLKARYYVRYVDDFIIMHVSPAVLAEYKKKIAAFLEEELLLALHPEKSAIIPLRRGVPLLGYRVFYRHKLPRKRNIRSIKTRVTRLIASCKRSVSEPERIRETLEGWSAYARHANTYQLRRKLGIETEMQIELLQSPTSSRTPGTGVSSRPSRPRALPARRSRGVPPG